MQNQEFSLIMISAMYENGGNTLHRFLDGHPELFVYPFESQLGNILINDFMSSVFPFKYRWPEFQLSGTPQNDYELFYDEELKVYLRTPFISKFGNINLRMDENERKRIFINLLKNKPRTRANIIASFFIATFEAWENYNCTGREKAYVGYSPIIVVDTEKIIKDFPNTHIVHIVRNPYSAYADTKRRPFPLPLERYTWIWNFVQYMALTFVYRFPEKVHIIRYEDLVRKPEETLTSLCGKIGMSFSEKLLYPFWNGTRLDKVYPWGTILNPTEEENIQRMSELSEDEHHRIRSISTIMLKALKYERS